MNHKINIEIPDCLRVVDFRYVGTSDRVAVQFYFCHLEGYCLFELVDTMRKQGFDFVEIEPHTDDKFVVGFVRKKEKESDECEDEDSKILPTLKVEEVRK